MKRGSPPFFYQTTSPFPPTCSTYNYSFASSQTDVPSFLCSSSQLWNQLSRIQCTQEGTCFAFSKQFWRESCKVELCNIFFYLLNYGGSLYRLWIFVMISACGLVCWQKYTVGTSDELYWFTSSPYWADGVLMRMVLHYIHTSFTRRFTILMTSKVLY